MSLPSDALAAFDRIAEIDSGLLVLGEREPCRCVLPSGIVRSAEFARGAIRGESAVSVVAAKRDIGEAPYAQEKATLDYHGRSYKLAVTEDDVTETGGALYEFVLAG